MLDSIAPVVVTRRRPTRWWIVIAVVVSLLVGAVIAGVIYRGRIEIQARELAAENRTTALEGQLAEQRRHYEEEIRRLHQVHARHLDRMRREGAEQVSLQRVQGSREVGMLQQENRKLRDQHVAVASQLARARQQLGIDGVAYRELSKAVEGAARQIAELREEVEFYRTILSPASDGRRLEIQSLRIEPAAQPNWYRYTLLLIQGLDQEHGIEGTVDIWIEGIQEHATRLLHVEDIGSAPDPIGFRYYQNVGGLFELPAGFMPARVRVVVETADPNAGRLERWYPWPNA